MTEEHWLTCADPERMLEFLLGAGAAQGQDYPFKETERRLRLLAVACARQLWDALVSKSSRRAVEVIERYADDPTIWKERQNVYDGARKAFMAVFRKGYSTGSDPDAPATQRMIRAADIAESITLSSPLLHHWQHITGNMASAGESAAMSCLIREVFGNPFRPVTFDPRWRTPQVQAVARTAYEEKRWEDLPLLADALEEASCDSADLLGHLRSRENHVRGCWALDLALNKS
jgi:hypothetical protein